jgi:hypothetical protein
MVYELRGNLAHFSKLKDRNNSFAPGDIDIREILNKLAEIMYLLGFQKWNTPHYVEQDSTYTESTQKAVDALLSSREDSQEMRSRYIEARNKWFGSSST